MLASPIFRFSIAGSKPITTSHAHKHSTAAYGTRGPIYSVALDLCSGSARVIVQFVRVWQMNMRGRLDAEGVEADAQEQMVMPVSVDGRHSWPRTLHIRCRICGIRLFGGVFPVLVCECHKIVKQGYWAGSYIRESSMPSVEMCRDGFGVFCALRSLSV